MSNLDIVLTIIFSLFGVALIGVSIWTYIGYLGYKKREEENENEHKTI